MYFVPYALSGSLSSSLHFATLSLAFLHPLSLTPFLPLFSAFSVFLCKRLKGMGFSMAIFSNLFFFFSSWNEMRADVPWHMGLMCALGLVYTVAYLNAVEEEKENIQAKVVRKEESVAWEKEREALEEELKRWKEEADQRRI